jgi:ribosomal protein S18 acetylase RimI-like enzyme
METTYSPLTNEDIPVIVAMMRDFYAIDGYPIDEKRSEALFSEFIANENLGRTWLIQSGGTIVGYVIMTFIFSFEFRGKIAFIDELYLSEAARGRGIGKSTVGFIKTEAKRLSVKMLYLEVEHHNSNAQKLYLAAGFETHNRKFMQLSIE